jgi:hypothetical protein
MRFMLRWGTSRMNWAWTTSLDQLWRSPAFPMWLTLAAAGFFGIIVLVTLVRAEKSVANGALTVITLLAVGIAVAAMIRGFGPGGSAVSAETPAPQTANATMPALSCIDDLAGETVMTACEKVVFGSAEATAAAVSYAASRITRLTALGDAAANKGMTPEQQALRRSIERDRYGVMAQVLQVRDHCTASDCAIFRFLTVPQQIAANIDARLYDSLVQRYAPSWNAPAPAAAGPVAALPASMPTGKPTNAEFPTSASIPPVSIMTPEPPPAAAAPAPRAPAAVATAPVPAPRPASTAASTASTAPALAAAKKPPAKPRPAAPAQITPPAPATPATND